MLSEQLNNRYSPPTPPPADVGREVVERWRVERKVYDALWRSYENHLLAKYAAASVSMTRIEHRQPVPDEFSQQRIGLQDSRLYIDLPDRPTVGAAP
jgi:hypothetical protein